MATEKKPASKRRHHRHRRRYRRRRPEEEREERRDWSALPDNILSSIAERLTTIADLISINLVCKSWKPVDLTVERAVLPSRPPLLFHKHDGTFYDMLDRRSYRRNDLDQIRREGYAVVGCTLGYLVLWGQGTKRGQLLIVNAFTGERFGGFPKTLERYDWFILSSPPFSPDCILMAQSALFDAFDYCRIGDEKWTSYKVPEASGIIAVFPGEKFYLLDMEGNLATFEVIPYPKLTPVAVESLPCRVTISPAFLGEIGGELFAVEMVYSVGEVKRFVVYRCDFSSGKWVRLISLGDRRALFVSTYAPYAIVDDPTRWGGLGDCIYFADHGYNSFSVFHMKNQEVECLHSHFLPKLLWPDCFWLLPGSSSLHLA